MGQLILVLGGARSGKSAFAGRLAAAGSTPVLFVATMEPGDDETRRRIERHKRERVSGWVTVEEPIDVVEAVSSQDPRPATVLLDCLTLWTANLLQRRLGEAPSLEAIDAAEAEVLRQVNALLDWQRAASANLVIISNEVGLGLVPPYPLGRAFRDVIGLAHQLIAAAAGRVYVLTAGIANEIKASAVPPTID
jgi:adenosylcobinamide kinase / adenosylcobinamide-phosphate guanylyltransferase